MLLQRAHNYINNPRQVPPFKATVFYKTGVSALDRFRVLFETLEQADVPILRALIDTFMNKTPPLQQTVQAGCLNALRLVE